jgi:hypothetical protein
VISTKRCSQASSSICKKPTIRYYDGMTASAVIEEIKLLPPSEQIIVIQFALELERIRQLAGHELSVLAQCLVDSNDFAKIEELKLALTSGFYGV